MPARLFLSIFLPAFLLAASPAFSQGAMPFPGRPAAPEFTLFNLEGKPVSLKDFRGKAVLLAFWQTT